MTGASRTLHFIMPGSYHQTLLRGIQPFDSVQGSHVVNATSFFLVVDTSSAGKTYKNLDALQLLNQKCLTYIWT